MASRRHPGIREHHGRYQVRYRDADGKQHAQSFRLITDARDFQRGVRTDVLRGDWFDPKLAQTPFRDFATSWMATTVHLRPSTQASYEVLLRRHIIPFFGGRSLGSIARTDVQAWMAERIAAGVGAGSVRNAYRVLSRILYEAERARMIPRNPATRVPLPRSARQEMRFLTPEQIGRLADAIDERSRVLVLMAAYTGLRFGELAALRVDRLDLLHGTVDVRESLSEVRGQLYVLPPKTGERRTVPLPRFLCAALEEHIARFSRDGHVFTSPDGQILRRNFYMRCFKPALAAAELDPGVRFHDLRHSAASIAIASGANVKQVQQMLGHSSATVTLDTYSHIFPSLAEQLRDGLDAAYRASLGEDVDQAWTKGGPGVRQLSPHVV